MNASAEQINASAEQITALADELAILAKNMSTTTDPMTKKMQTHKAVMQAKSLIMKIQDPMEAMMDHTAYMHLLASLRSLVEIGVFDALPASESMTVAQLATKCDADEELIIRLFRQCTCAGIFEEVRLGEYAHNRLSIGMSQHAGMLGRYFFTVCYDEMMPAITCLPAYMHKFGKHNINTYTDTPHSFASNMLGKTFWEVLTSDPNRLDKFNRGLSLFATTHPILGTYPFTDILASHNSPTRPLCVDIGGGRGNALLQIRKGCPDLKGELILQDRPEVIESISAEELPDVTKRPHDFFTPQPVQHAQVYYIRRVLHDWQDPEATKILQAIMPAMAPDSRILISEMALPEPVGIEDSNAVWLDLMMLTIGGKERTARDWEKLVEGAGLRLVKIWMTEKTGPLAVVECMLKEGGEGAVKEPVVVVQGQKTAIPDEEPKLGTAEETNGANVNVPVEGGAQSNPTSEVVPEAGSHAAAGLEPAEAVKKLTNGVSHIGVSTEKQDHSGTEAHQAATQYDQDAPLDVQRAAR